MREDRTTPAPTRGARQQQDTTRTPDASSSGTRRSGSAGGRGRTTAGRARAARGTDDAAATPESAPRASAARTGGDYLGVGDPCRVCGRPVDASQARCPHCGAFQRPLYTNPVFIAGCVVAAALVVLLSIGINSCASRSADPASPGDTPAASNPSEGQNSALTDAIAAAQSTVDQNAATPTYTAASIATLQQAIASAQAVADDANASEEQVSQAASALATASNGLVLRPVAFGSNYIDPWYDPLVEALATDPSYAGTQISMEAVVGAVSTGTEGSVATVYISGDTACPLQLTATQFTDLTGVDGVLAQDVHILFAGTVTGLVTVDNGDGTTSSIPAVTADYIAYYEG